MAKAWLECISCSARFTIGPMFYGCPGCAARGNVAPLEVAYDLRAVDFNSPSERAAGLWRWTSLLPPVREDSKVSLGEGRTPLVPIHCGSAGISAFLKNETANPTWSWKDRPNCVSVSMAREFRLDRTAAISTGNHGCAAAAYSTAAGLSCVIFCHPDAPPSQPALMKAFGARIVRGGNQEDLFRRLLQRGDYYPCSIFCPRSGFANPFGIDGFKTIAFEIFEQLGGKVPDQVFVPVGSGDGIYGIWKGFRELRELGLASKAPKMIACQATGAGSAFRGFQRKSAHSELLDSTSTVALSIAERITGDHALRAVYESGGSVLACSDEKILEAKEVLTRQGFALEAASAVALACLRQVASEWTADETWIVIGSGSVVKWGTLINDFEMPPLWDSDKLPD